MRVPRLVVFPLAVLIISNLPVVSEILSIVFYDTVGVPFHFISEDAHYYAVGDYDKIVEGDSYKLYRQSFPSADHQLYRCFRKKEWQYLFLWRIFLTNANWKAQYISDPFFISGQNGDYDLGFNGTPRSYFWDENKKQWSKKRSLNK